MTKLDTPKNYWELFIGFERNNHGSIIVHYTQRTSCFKLRVTAACPGEHQLQFVQTLNVTWAFPNSSWSNHPVSKLFSLGTCKCGVTNARGKSVEQRLSDQEVFKHVSSIYLFFNLKYKTTIQQSRSINNYTKLAQIILHKENYTSGNWTTYLHSNSFKCNHSTAVKKMHPGRLWKTMKKLPKPKRNLLSLSWKS